MYLIIFIVADIVSLVLQAIGGGGAAVKAKQGEDTDKSTKISAPLRFPLTICHLADV